MAEQNAAAGAAIYNKTVLSVYDLFVLGFSNRWVWRCPTPLILDFYNTHVSANHLDVGVGTGYFLDQCRFPSSSPAISLLDLNPNSLAITARRLGRYQPSTYVANVLEPLRLTERFDSISLNYLLHCLPGSMLSKEVVFQNLKSLLNDGQVIFGTTLLGQGTPHNFLARSLRQIYNKKGIFSNQQDNLADLETVLSQHFAEYKLDVIGCVAFFVGRT
jgi:hypothetical protein